MHISPLVAETVAEGNPSNSARNRSIFEAVDIQLKAMTGAEEDRQQLNRIEQGGTADQFKGNEAKARCYRCDREGHPSRDSCCPARNAECQRCHKIGHFTKVCQTKTVTRSKDGF